MADLVTHLLVNQLLGQERLSGAALRWFVAGALLPDLASRVPRMVLKAAMGQGWVDSGPTSRAILFGLDVPHMPIGFALVCVAAAALAPVSWLPGGRRRRAGGGCWPVGERTCCWTCSRSTSRPPTRTSGP